MPWWGWLLLGVALWLLGSVLFAYYFARFASLAVRSDDAAVLAAARKRLDWLLEEYGPDDINYVTFAPIVAALAERVERGGDRRARGRGGRPLRA